MATLHAKDHETIVAQCTPQGSGALALLRLSGDNSFAIAGQMCRLVSGKKITELPSHTIHYGMVIDDQGNTVDHAMFIAMRGPKTFTGQDTIEITCHNNQFLVERIINRAIECGARLADGGEFSRRSVLNDKMDLLQAEAVNELIHAAHQLSLKQSLSQLDGSFSGWIATIEKRLIKCLALSEASFEFLDEEDMGFADQMKQLLAQIASDIKVIKKTFDQQQQIRDGVKVALLGSVNAGKSSLFNALLAKERAIVTEIAGTTRDVIEAGLFVDGVYWTLIDTAGLRSTDDIVEKKGIERSLQEAHKADIILLVIDAARDITNAEQAVYQDIIDRYGDKISLVHNKCDLIPVKNITDRVPGIFLKNNGYIERSSLHVSCNLPNTVTQLHTAIKEKVTTLFNDMASPFLLNKRQFHLLSNLEKNIYSIVPMLDGDVAYELVSCHLQDAIANLSELTGKSISEAGMDAVFRTFCVGK